MPLYCILVTNPSGFDKYTCSIPLSITTWNFNIKVTKKIQNWYILNPKFYIYNIMKEKKNVLHDFSWHATALLVRTYWRIFTSCYISSFTMYFSLLKIWFICNIRCWVIIIYRSCWAITFSF
jgi:hypothetical protein